MTRFSQRDCLDLSMPGTHEVEMEITLGKDPVLLCPCCHGSGEHEDRPGNNPDSLAYSCGTCEGRGLLDWAPIRSSLHRKLAVIGSDWPGRQPWPRPPLSGGIPSRQEAVRTGILIPRENGAPGTG